MISCGNAKLKTLKLDVKVLASWLMVLIQAIGANPDLFYTAIIRCSKKRGLDSSVKGSFQ